MDLTDPVADVRHMQLRELLLGIEGLALLRGMSVGDDKTVEARIDEVRWLADEANPELDERTPVRELDVESLYRTWADTYDDASRPIRPIEEPVVWSLLEHEPPGRALDAACGTGRHARRLAELGHQVTGVDLSAEMLAKARERMPDVDFRIGELAALPLESDAFDLVVCGLAVDHCPSLAEPLAELARVTRPGGRVIVSDINPIMSILGGAAHVKLDEGARGFARNHAHLHSDFLSAFSAAGLEVQRLYEPRYETDHLALKRTAMSLVPEATLAAYLGLPAVVVWDLRRR